MSDYEHCSDSDEHSGARSSDEATEVVSTAAAWLQMPLSAQPGHCSDGEESLGAHSSGTLDKIEILQMPQNADACTCYARQEKVGIEGQNEGSKDLPSMPPLPTKLLKAAFSTSACEALSEAHTADAALDDMFPSVEEVENAQARGESCSTEDLYTVMLKNIPCRCSRQDFLDLLAAHGWGDSYDFFHLPTPKKPSKGFRGSLGYAFIGFPDPKVTKRFMQEMKGVRFPGRNSKKELDVVPARLQGLQENLTQLAKKKIIPNKTSLEESPPKQESAKAAPKKPQSRKADVNQSDPHQDMAAMPHYSWSQMNGFGSSNSMWNGSLQYWSGNGQQSHGIEEFCMRMASAEARSVNSDRYVSNAGFVESYGTQPSQQHSYWSPTFDDLEVDVASEEGSLSPRADLRFLEAAAAASDAGSAPDANLEVACSESGLEPAERAEEEMPEEIFTLMMKNIPCRCSQQEVLDLLDDHGWGDAYNFFHLPSPPSSCKGWKGCLGYAFIGFPNSDLTKRFMQEMKGVGFTMRKSAKVLDIAPARYQGLEDNLAQLSGKKVNQSHRAPIYRRHAGPVQELSATLSF